MSLVFSLIFFLFLFPSLSNDDATDICSIIIYFLVGALSLREVEDKMKNTKRSRDKESEKMARKFRDIYFSNLSFTLTEMFLS